ncbi:dTMP kinase [Acinetobacter qingfengensis]|uniref:Thymidylate kinase n=1 Tax=Acinetobacter qingfengensis TaxID=1262585 RepID=A0A1E7REH0_9GAMM|nr:dTMP kinase [Acinetobacter qingfengensis]KAA8734364.1 dTMP kinase [Acinetobacter qingfengensis]OEY97627.1 dTMP kinase [Acinetobacter qingfengensis]
MFISFEGTEGVGKSTLIATLQATLVAQQYDVILTREPGGTPLAEKIRQLLLQPDQEKMCASTELLLIYAARAQHLDQVILPALNANKIVLCDRFVDASIAYQCGGRGLDRQHIDLLTENFVSRLPDITFWLDAPVEVGMQRAQKRAALDRFEQEKTEFFNRVRQTYQAIATQSPQRVVCLDATQTPKQIAEIALQYIRQKI